ADIEGIDPTQGADIHERLPVRGAAGHAAEIGPQSLNRRINDERLASVIRAYGKADLVITLEQVVAGDGLSSARKVLVDAGGALDHVADRGADHQIILGVERYLLRPREGQRDDLGIGTGRDIEI